MGSRLAGRDGHHAVVEEALQVAQVLLYDRGREGPTTLSIAVDHPAKVAPVLADEDRWHIIRVSGCPELPRRKHADPRCKSGCGGFPSSLEQQRDDEGGEERDSDGADERESAA